MELSEFLLARIAEDETTRMGGDYARWRMGRVLYEQAGETPDWNRVPAEQQEDWARAADRVIADVTAGWWNPPRVLAECATKRRVVEGARRLLAPMPGQGPFWDGAADAITGVLRLLALPYADHPDYRSEWAP